MATRNLTGWKRQPPDPRDFRYIPPRRVRANLPASFDLTAGMGPLLNQDQLGSCGPFSADELIAFDQKAEGLPVVGASPLFVYYFTRQLMGTMGQDSGVDNRNLLKALNQFGYCAEADWPYDEARYNQRPPQAAIDKAAGNKITNYAAVGQDPGVMQGTLVGGHPFLFGFDAFQQIMSDQAALTGIVTAPARGASPVGGHDVPIVGFNSTGRALPGILPRNFWPSGYYRVRNHWVNADGTPWGDGGYGYIPYDYAHGPHASDFWVINAVPGAPPTPPAPGGVTSIGVSLQLDFASLAAGTLGDLRGTTKVMK